MSAQPTPSPQNVTITLTNPKGAVIKKHARVLKKNVGKYRQKGSK